MRYLHLFVNFLLLFTTPSLILYPHTNVQVGAIQEISRALLQTHILSYDDILDLITDLETGELDKRCTEADLENINHFLVKLAREGVLPNGEDEEFHLESDIQALLHTEANLYEYALSSNRGDDLVIVPALLYDQGEFVLCKSWAKKKWDETRKFVKKHKKAIIIGAVIVVAAAAVICALALASTAVAVAGAAAASESDKKEEEPTASPPSLDAHPEEAPILKAAVEEHISSFKELMAEDVILESCDYSTIQSDSSLGEKVRNLGALLAHETLNGVSEITVIVPQINDELRALASCILPKSLPRDDSSIVTVENHEHLIASGHQKIDQLFLTEQAALYTPEAKAKANRFVTGIIPLPGNLSKGISVSKFREIVVAGQETAVLAEELGFTAQEIAHLKQAGSLEKTVVSTFESLVSEKALLESLERFRKAEAFLTPYSKEYLSEIQIRELIHQAGMKTFPRPSGIPENFRVKLSDRGAGIVYTHPENNHISVRVMPGKPHSPNLYQQKPYVICKKHGNTLDKFGNIVDPLSQEAHIPLNEFTYREH